MKAKLDSKFCGVCGDKALGYNFNAVTCESCKAFFRRNALVEKEFKCPFNNQCEITTVTRRFCQKCRLDKCFNIGMCKDLIMSEEDKVLKRQKVEENRARKRNHNHEIKTTSAKRIKKEQLTIQQTELVDSEIFSNYCTDSDSKDTNTSDGNQLNTSSGGTIEDSDDLNLFIKQNIPNTPSSIDDIQCLSNISSAESLSPNYYVQSNNNPCNSPMAASGTLEFTKDVMKDVQRVNLISPNPIESILCEAIKLEYEAYTSLTQSHSHSRELNDAERAKLNELIVASKALLSPVDDELNKLIGDGDIHSKSLLHGNTHQILERDPALVDLINLTALVVRQLIKMAKKINAFKNMCQEDQVALLKGGCTEIMMLRSAMHYDPTQQTWKIPLTQESLNLNVGVLKLAKGNIYQEHERFINTFDPKWRVDENIITILCAIVLFTPDRSRVIHQDVIRLEQNSYYYLLRRYLESIYAGCEAKSTFLKLIQKITELHKFNEELINVYLDVNPAEIEPLLLELLDLK